MLSIDQVRAMRRPDLPRREVHLPVVGETALVRMLTHGEVQEAQAAFAAHADTPTKGYPRIVVFATVNPDGSQLFPADVGESLVRSMPWPDVRAIAETAMDISGMRGEDPKGEG